MQTPIFYISGFEDEEIEYMNPANYKVDRNKPKQNNTLSKSKKQLLANSKPTVCTGTPKLRAIYKSKSQWATKILPKLKEQ